MSLHDKHIVRAAMTEQFKLLHSFDHTDVGGIHTSFSSTWTTVWHLTDLTDAQSI